MNELRRMVGTVARRGQSMTLTGTISSVESSEFYAVRLPNDSIIKRVKGASGFRVGQPVTMTGTSGAARRWTILGTGYGAGQTMKTVVV